MKKTAEELFDECEELDRSSVIHLMEKYHNQFKVEPGLTLQQCKDQVARKDLYDDWTDLLHVFTKNNDIVEICEKLEEACELYTASLTSEIKGLREEIEISVDWLMKCIGVIEQLVSYEPSQAAKDKVNEYVQKIKEKLSTKTATE